MNKYEIVRDLGTGSYGKVTLGKNRRTGEQVAIKEIQIANLAPEAKEKALQEVQVLKSLDHPNIVRLRDSFQEKGVLYIVMEYVDGGDLAEKIRGRGNKPFTEEEILDVFIQLTLALEYIHEKKIVHRDIKPQNVFLTKVGVIKLGDFGVARALEDTHDLCQTVIGTPYYLSPEIWNNEPYNSMTDIWSLGCILYEMCALKRPFTGRAAAQLFAMVIRGKYDPIPSRYSKNTKMLVDSMLTLVASQRPTASQILQVPFIKTKIMGKIKENEAQLKTVNIIVSESRITTAKQARANNNFSVSRKKSAPSHRQEPLAKLPKLQPPEQKLSECELPLPPDEEAPRWAQRGSGFIKPDAISVPHMSGKINEYQDLQDATDKLQESLSLPVSSVPGWAKSEEVPMDTESVRDKAGRIRTTIEEKLGEKLFNLLYKNIQQEDEIYCAQFVDIMNENDPDIVEKMRELISLENMLL